MEIKKEWQGINSHRYKNNPQELKFAEVWQKLNDRDYINKGKTIDYILNKGDEKFVDICSERDQEVACSIIQWLGSPIGQGFLYSVKEVK